MRMFRWSTAVILVVAVHLSGGPARGAGGNLTACVHICPGYPNVQLCIPTQDVTVVAGSLIDCGTRDVQLTNASLKVSDGLFTLKARSLLVQQGAGSDRSITADCPQSTDRHGFTIETTQGITVGAGGLLRANCPTQGGTIVLDAGTAVSIGGSGVQANGTALSAPGGTLSIRSAGSVTTTAGLTAYSTSTDGNASGGTVNIAGTTITIGGGIDVHGTGLSGGGFIGIDASGDVTVSSSGVLNANVDSGVGGSIEIESNGTVTTSRPLRAQGKGGSALGGSVGIRGRHVTVDNEIVVTGGLGEGEVRLTATRGKVTVGVGSAAAIDAGVSSNNAGKAGIIEVRSVGNDVTIGPNGKLKAAQMQGSGGAIDIDGVNVTVLAGSELLADGFGDDGGLVAFTASGAVSVAGLTRANNGLIEVSYRSGTPSLPGVQGTPSLVLDSSIAAPCGDGTVRLGVEACDPGDLDGATCASQGRGSGSLGCKTDCTFDYSGCSN